MTGAPAALQVAIRPYRDDDEPAVLRLMHAALGAGPTGDRRAELFRWKHLDNPFGRSLMLVAEAEGGSIVGLRAFLRWRLRSGARVLRAVRAVDTATHPDYQGRGIFTRLTREAVEALRGEVDLVFNTPNERSLPGYLKMGWRTVGRLPILVAVRRPLRVVGGITRVRGDGAPRRPRPAVDAEPVARALADRDRLANLLERAAILDRRIATDRDTGYLDWRYGRAPLLDYRAVREEDGGVLRGLAVFRVRPRGPLWEATVAEVIVPAGDVRTAARLLRRVRAATAVDHVAASFPAGTPAAGAARRVGFLRVPGGPTLVVNPLRADLRPDPHRPESWAVGLGDMEVF